MFKVRWVCVKCGRVTVFEFYTKEAADRWEAQVKGKDCSFYREEGCR